MIGKIHSYQSMGTVDGPGVRFVVFMQGCPLRCAYCHNPDTWEYETKSTIHAAPEEVFNRIKRCRPYFGKEGGVTVSGGEVLLQAQFVTELFRLCRAENISTCLDTSGCILNRQVEKLLGVTDTVLLDIKMTNSGDYKTYVGTTLEKVMAFLNVLEEKNIDTWIRQVIVPGFNDTEENISKLYELIKDFKCIKKIELLPFRKLCSDKYKEMKIEFPFGKYSECSPERIEKMRRLLENYTNKKA